jgi:hypothetical protein
MEHTDKPNREAGCSFIGLRDYFTLWLERLEIFSNRRFQDLEEKTALALSSADKAVIKAETATEKRFEGVNEFRQTLSDQASTFMPREEYNARHEALVSDMKKLASERIATIETQISRLYGGLAVIAFIGIANLVKVWLIH